MTTRSLIRLSFAAGLIASLVLSSGCSSVGARVSMADVAALSPAAKVVTAADAAALSQAYVAAHPGAQVSMGTGDSMMPLYKDNTVIVSEPRPMGELKPGMTVVFKSAAGWAVCHVLVSKTSDGWITQGVNNAEADESEVTAENYVGVVVRAYQLDGNPMLALARSLSTEGRNEAYAAARLPAAYTVASAQ